MKKLIALLLSMSMAVSLMLAGCGSSSSNSGTSDPSQTTSSEEASNAETSTEDASSGEVYEFNFSSQATESSINGQWDELLADKIYEVTDGHVVINWYYSSTLVGENDVVSAIRTGLCDGGEVPMARQSSAFPLFNLLMEPYSNLGNGETIWANVIEPLMEEYPELTEEFDGLHIAGFYACTNGGTLHTTSPVRVPSDLDGLMISTVTSFQTNITIAAGGSPMTLESSDWYTSFERGLADGMWMTWGAIQSMNLYEVLPYHTVFPSGTDRSMTTVCFSDSAWSKLPAEYQDAITSIIGWSCEQWPAIEAADYESMVEMTTEAGNTFLELTEEEEAEWSDLAADLVMQDVEAVNDLGLPGTEFYTRIQELATENQ